jgi:hypothetical protein
MLDLHVLVALAASFAIRPCAGMTSYANEFFSPETVLDSSWVADAKWAQSNTVEDAEWIAAQGPWSESGLAAAAAAATRGGPG